DGPQRLEPGEQCRPVVLEWADLLAGIADGRIEDGKTIAAVLFYDRFFRR
ncbi:MAG: NUDIX hydrolase, partial [Polyangiaceae bacterium]|nr:NUDIX hydrolase [Polyangiaceae bacterium]